MLIKRSYVHNDIVSIKLINGDEIIAKFDEELGDNITIHRPLALTMGPNGLGMMPWMLLGDDETVILKRDHVFAITLTKKDAADQYLQGTTGIALM